MAFLVENPSFAFDVSDQVDIHQSESGVMQSSILLGPPLHLRQEIRLVVPVNAAMGGCVVSLLTVTLFVSNVVGLIVIWIISVMNACRGPRRRWRLM